MVKSFTFIWKSILIFAIVFSSRKTNFLHTFQPQSSFCEPMDKPCRQNYPESDCYMKYYKLNSTECRDMVFSHYSDVQGSTDLGYVKLEPYHYDLLSYKQTGFNITFANISWSGLKFRFQQEGNEMKNTCREIHMSPNSTIKNLFYDCLWSNESYEGKTFVFQYEMTRDESVKYSRYYFQVPFAKNIEKSTTIENWEIFLYAEVVSNVFGVATIVLHWTPLPEKFAIDTYNVTVFQNNFNQSEVVSFTNVTCTTSENCKFVYNKWHGSFQFGVQPMTSTQSKCFMAKTIIFNLGKENTRSLLIGIVSVTLIVPAFVYVLFLMRNYFISKTKNWFYSMPKLLVVVSPSVPSHNEVVSALVEYLETYCHVEPLMDELHIFRSASRDPFKWCNEAIKSADFVMVVASPHHKNHQITHSVYRRTDTLLLNLLQERLSLKGHKTNFFTLMFPYCTENDIPEEAINLKRFFFPDDLNKMLKFIHKNNLLHCYLSSDIQGGKSTYKMFGTKLNHTILQAQNSLMKTNIEIDKMILEENSVMSTDTEHFLLVSPQEMKKDETKKENVVLEKIRENSKPVKPAAEEIFKKYPGRLDDLNLSGEEAECLVPTFKKPSKENVINLDVLDL